MDFCLSPAHLRHIEVVSAVSAEGALRPHHAVSESDRPQLEAVSHYS